MFLHIIACSSTDSCALHLCESNAHDKSNINDESNTNDEHNFTKEIPFDVSDSEIDNATVSQMQVDLDEDEPTSWQHIESYSLRLPTLAQIMPQSELE